MSRVMQRGNGSVVGPATVASATAAPERWDLFDEYLYDYESLWPNAILKSLSTPVTVLENSTNTVTVVTTLQFAVGSTLYWYIAPDSTNPTDAADFATNGTYGSFVVANASAPGGGNSTTFTYTTLIVGNPNKPIKKFTVQIRSATAGGGVLYGETGSVTISPVTTSSLAWRNTSAAEGGTVIYLDFSFGPIGTNAPTQKIYVDFGGTAVMYLQLLSSLSGAGDRQEYLGSATNYTDYGFDYFEYNTTSKTTRAYVPANLYSINSSTGIASGSLAGKVYVDQVVEGTQTATATAYISSPSNPIATTPTALSILDYYGNGLFFPIGFSPGLGGGSVNSIERPNFDINANPSGITVYEGGTYGIGYMEMYKADDSTGAAPASVTLSNIARYVSVYDTVNTYVYPMMVFCSASSIYTQVSGTTYTKLPSLTLGTVSVSSGVYSASLTATWVPETKTITAMTRSGSTTVITHGFGTIRVGAQIYITGNSVTSYNSTGGFAVTASDSTTCTISVAYTGTMTSLGSLQVNSSTSTSEQELRFNSPWVGPGAVVTGVADGTGSLGSGTVTIATGNSLVSNNIHSLTVALKSTQLMTAGTLQAGIPTVTTNEAFFGNYSQCVYTQIVMVPAPVTSFPYLDFLSPLMGDVNNGAYHTASLNGGRAYEIPVNSTNSGTGAPWFKLDQFGSQFSVKPVLDSSKPTSKFKLRIRNAAGTLLRESTEITIPAVTISTIVSATNGGAAITSAQEGTNVFIRTTITGYRANVPTSPEVAIGRGFSSFGNTTITHSWGGAASAVDYNVYTNNGYSDSRILNTTGTLAYGLQTPLTEAGGTFTTQYLLVSDYSAEGTEAWVGTATIVAGHNGVSVTKSITSNLSVTDDTTPFVSYITSPGGSTAANTGGTTNHYQNLSQTYTCYTIANTGTTYYWKIVHGATNGTVDNNFYNTEGSFTIGSTGQISSATFNIITRFVGNPDDPTRNFSVTVRTAAGGGGTLVATLANMQVQTPLMWVDVSSVTAAEGGSFTVYLWTQYVGSYAASPLDQGGTQTGWGLSGSNGASPRATGSDFGSYQVTYGGVQQSAVTGLTDSNFLPRVPVTFGATPTTAGVSSIILNVKTDSLIEGTEYFYPRFYFDAYNPYTLQTIAYFTKWKTSTPGSGSITIAQYTISIAS